MVSLLGGHCRSAALDRLYDLDALALAQHAPLPLATGHHFAGDGDRDAAARRATPRGPRTSDTVRAARDLGRARR